MSNGILPEYLKQLKNYYEGKVEGGYNAESEQLPEVEGENRQESEEVGIDVSQYPGEDYYKKLEHAYIHALAMNDMEFANKIRKQLEAFRSKGNKETRTVATRGRKTWEAGMTEIED